MADATETDALLQRLRAVAPHLGEPVDALEDLADRGVGPLLHSLGRRLQADPRFDHIWLLYTAVTATYPTADEVRSLRRTIRLAGNDNVHVVILQACSDAALRGGGLSARARIVEDGVIVDVNFSARTDHNTGVQRVVRQTMSRWEPIHSPELVVWTDRSNAYRPLTETEHDRLLRWGGRDSAASADVVEQPEIIIPIRGALTMIEVPQQEQCPPLAAIAEFTQTRVAMVVHDAIPVISADTVPDQETNRFVDYLSIVKHADRLSGVSKSAAAEFQGFVNMLTAQGIRGPEVVAVPLPSDVPHRPEHVDPVSGVPLVLVVGSQEPRKNHYAILYAAERLWREGVQFRLRFIGGGSTWFIQGFDAEIKRLRRRGYNVEVLRGVNDATLVRSYAEAAFTVFPSLHEGFGLPVGESLAMGVPVITTNYGSTAEIAADGGCLLVDPRDEDDLMGGMRRLLTEPAELERLRAEAAARAPRTWDDYSSELWEALVQPLIGRPIHAE